MRGFSEERTFKLNLMNEEESAEERVDRRILQYIQSLQTCLYLANVTAALKTGGKRD